VAVSLSIIMTWMLSASTIVGIGSPLLRRLDVEYSLFHSFWNGLCITIAITQVYHLFRQLIPSSRHHFPPWESSECFLTEQFSFPFLSA
jgi:hypothetical protein